MNNMDNQIIKRYWPEIKTGMFPVSRHEIPHIKLIYGVHEKLDLIQPFQHYYLPMNDIPKDERTDDTFTGFIYDIIDSPYDTTKFSYDKLCLNESDVPQAIKQKFFENYPDKTPCKYALIQNVYTSHYVGAEIVYGFWLKTLDIGEDELDKLSDVISTLSRGRHDCDSEITCLTTYNGHNKYYPGDFFIGIYKNHISHETANDCKNSAKNLSEIYIPTGEIEKSVHEWLRKNLPDYLENLELAYIPMITTIESMCHCCT